MIGIDCHEAPQPGTHARSISSGALRFDAKSVAGHISRRSSAALPHLARATTAHCVVIRGSSTSTLPIVVQLSERELQRRSRQLQHLS